MKIYVVKVFLPDEEEWLTISYALTFKRAKELANETHNSNWIIEEWPIGRRLDPRERREAWSDDLMFGDKFVPAGTLVGPYDGFVVTTRRGG